MGLGCPGSVEFVDLAGLLALDRPDVGLADLGEPDRGEAREVVAVDLERLGEHRWADRVDPLRGDLDRGGANERLQRPPAIDAAAPVTIGDRARTPVINVNDPSAAMWWMPWRTSSICARTLPWNDAV